MVERTLIRPPSSRLGPCSPDARARAIAQSPVAGLYEATKDRVSAFEMLQKRAEDAARAAEEEALEEENGNWRPARRDDDADHNYRGDDDAPTWRRTGEYRNARRYKPMAEPKPRKPSSRSRSRSSRSDSIATTFTKSVMRTAGTQIARSLVRGVLGGLFKGR